MKTGAHYFLTGLLFSLSAACHADDEATFPYLIPQATAITNSERAGAGAFPGHGCVEASAFLLPAPFGDAGMHAFVQADGTRTTCAFHTRSQDVSRLNFFDASDTNEIQRATGTFHTPTDGFPGTALSASPAETDPSPRLADREIESATPTPRPAVPLSGLSAPDRLGRAIPGIRPRQVSRRAGDANETVSSPHYRWFLFVFVLLLALALLALIGLVGMLVYLRWFSEHAILARAVNRGLRRSEFYLEYQPVFYIGTRKCIGLEVALRWKNIAYGLRGEAWYMDRLVDRRSARKIVAFVLSTAETELGSLADDRKLYLMINLWKTCLDNEACLSLIAAKAKSFASSRLVFQVKAEDLPEQLGSIARLRKDQVRIALSGIRAATSVTASLLSAGFEFIRADRDVMGLEESDRLRTLRAIAAMGRELDVAVIADGVEGIGQSRAVARAKIELAQGYFLGKAISAAQLPTFFEKLDWWQGKHVPAASAVGISR
ncbi:EAL domain-containing protein [Paraburkholderia sp. BCC1885]|uniref:EAL domain-containing protein n=1 Tax=Paraburkholderia sp. BCC1885 TaxID=2562669 RepID=UPI0011825624|nr:EAL domain-containing protein [Paraburkholderia sp. BCC1885]